MMIDLDFFKRCNDTYGHWKGDELLKICGNSLTENVKDRGIASRMGGDEFSAMVIFDIGTSQKIIEKFANDVCKSINFAISEFESGVTISMGVSFSFNKKMTFNSLYKLADSALYESKKSGRNKVTIVTE